MSRNIVPKSSVTITEEEEQSRRTESGKLLFTSFQGRSCALFVQNNRLVEAAFFPEKPGMVGSVFIGKVKNAARNINACFVEISRGEVCFLPMKNAEAPYLLNRSYDGRIVEGDELLVQVVRDAQKSKRASVTAQISLASEYFVLSIGSAKTGYSSKLSGRQKSSIRRILKENGILEETSEDCLTQNVRRLLSASCAERLLEDGFLLDTLKLPPMGLIVRTKAGETEGAEELLEKFYDLSLQYIKLLYIARHRSCYTCLKEAASDFAFIAERLAGESADLEMVTDRQDIYERLTEEGFRVRLYQDKLLSLSCLYSIESKIKTAFESRVWLKSGGYLIIEPTEALTVIDVNSGKCEAGKSAEEAYHKINLEAAEEVAHQLRLRNLSGIIIVDFINMRSPSAEQELLHYLRELTAKDRVPTQIVDMTRLGLVEITRKKINKPLKEQFQDCVAN